MKSINLNSKFKKFIYILGVWWGLFFGILPGIVIRLVMWDSEIWDFEKQKYLDTQYQKFCYFMGFIVLIPLILVILLILILLFY